MEELYLKYLSEEKEFIINKNKKEEFYDAHNLKCVQAIVKIIDKYILNQENNNIKVLEIMKITKNTEIKEAIKNVKYKYLNLYLKIIIFLIKNKKYRIIVMLSKVRKFIKENKKFRKKVEFF